MKQTLATICLAVVLTSRAHAAPVDFVRDVRPILQQHCYECHGAASQKSGLRLDVKSAAFKGGELYEASIVVGNADESPLVQFVADEDADLIMPPDGDGLSDAEIATLTRWVNEGAVWPDDADLAQLEDLRDHWSFKPLSDPTPPQTRDEMWPRHAIDRFVLARLEQAGLCPAPEADRVTWLRRVSLDLIGLPPTPQEVADFVHDTDEDAFERVVDRLLRSPRYGERWAQHWLDVVRYADTHGFEVNTERPNAWPYRDYVIGAFNNDTPYDRFVREQIVGDAMGQDAATGFLVTASVLLPGQIGKDAPSKRLARQDAIDEIVVNITQTFLGLSVGCARCHEHKFDPITQRDYYSMQAFVAGVEYKDRELLTPEVIAARQDAQQAKARVADIDQQLARLAPLVGSGVERPMINARQNTDRFSPVKARRLRFTIRSTNKLEPCIDELEVFSTDGENIALASAGTTVESSGDKVSANRHELRFLNEGQYGNSHSWMSNEVGRGWVELGFAAEVEIDRVVWGRDREGKFADRLATDYGIEVAATDGQWQVVADASDRVPFDPAAEKSVPFSFAGLSEAEVSTAELLISEKAELEAKIKAAADTRQVFAGVFREPDQIHLLTRGNPEQPKDLVQPAVLSAFGSLQLPIETAERQRRDALADWIASPENPLTARVMVNRIWQGHFGTGLVETVSDFGHSGQQPSHPDLLDWLAAEFLRSGWSIKHMHKLIVLSATYRQASATGGRITDPASPSTELIATSSSDTPVPADQKNDPESIDADVRLLWRYPSRRVDAETIRDAMLGVSGQLDLKMYGRGYNLFDKRGGLSGFKPVEQFTGDGLRRMIYAHKVRRERDAVFGAFDCPDGGQSTPRRRQSTTPIQALNLFNSRFTLDQADALAARVMAEVGDDPSTQVQHTYQLALTRDPDPDELRDALSVVQTYGLATFCRALFNSNEFLFIP